MFSFQLPIQPPFAQIIYCLDTLDKIPTSIYNTIIAIINATSIHHLYALRVFLKSRFRCHREGEARSNPHIWRGDCFDRARAPVSP